MTDRFGRTADYLRLSLTDACNLRCIYCMLQEMAFRPPDELLQDDEIHRLVPVFARLGFRKFRLTGGEPTLREGLVDIVRRMTATPGVREVTMTTNGVRLAGLAGPLAGAGLRRINVRLDTLDPEKFRTMSRRDGLDAVLNGIRAAEAAGLSIKINAVIVRGYNETEDAVDLARLTLEHPWQVRFIEVMPIGRVGDAHIGRAVPEAELRSTIERSLGPLTPAAGGPCDGEARLYELVGARGRVGFITSVTRPFCGHCVRARLTADGRLRPCLLHETEVDLLGPLRSGAADSELQTLIRGCIRCKPEAHDLARHIVPRNRVMSEIGG
ncbi:MAG: GTP 3',8-cyclase MoaA [Verrucomicrobiota bacterium]